jgi:hypothetical protein
MFISTVHTVAASLPCFIINTLNINTLNINTLNIKTLNFSYRSTLMTHNQDVCGLTAGHVLEGHDLTFTVKHRVSLQQITASVAIGPTQNSTGFNSEVGILKINHEDRKLVKTCFLAFITGTSFRTNDNLTDFSTSQLRTAFTFNSLRSTPIRWILCTKTFFPHITSITRRSLGITTLSIGYRFLYSAIPIRHVQFSQEHTAQRNHRHR